MLEEEELDEKEFKKVADEVLKLLDGKSIGISWRLSLTMLGALLEGMNVPINKIEKFMKILTTEFFIVSTIEDENLAEELRKKSQKTP